MSRMFNRMFNHKPIAAFLCRFAVIFLVLALPWPGVNSAYISCFRALAGMILSGDNGRRELSFESREANSEHSSGFRVEIVNPRLMHSDGSGPVRSVDVDFNLQPAALLVALSCNSHLMAPARLVIGLGLVITPWPHALVPQFLYME